MIESILFQAQNFTPTSKTPVPIQLPPQISLIELQFGDLIGRGSFSDVYAGLYRDSKVAIKQLRAGTGIEELNREAELLSRLGHPNIVSISGIVTVDRLCLVLEYIPGGSLHSFLHEGLPGKPPLPTDWALALLRDLAVALEFLHRQRPRPITHRDLKSLNVLVRDDFTLALTDFGSAKLMRTTQGAASTHTGRVGTVAYM